MAIQSYTSRRQAVEQVYPIPVIVVAPLIALFFQAFLPLRLPSLNLLDLPLLIVIYAALSRRSAMAGSLVGAGIGLAQDALTNLPLGVFGIAKTIVGFFSASVSMKLDTDNAGTRFLLTLSFVVLHDAIVYLIRRFLINTQPGFSFVHEALRAVVNAVLAVGIFLLLDRFRRRT